MRLIFKLYLEGYSAGKIRQYLEENQIKTATGQDKWYDSVIFKMLRNEKYMGDALLQKTYTDEFDEQYCRIPEFDNDLVRRLIGSIKVVSA